jgi:hypothetical protein
MSRVLVFPGNDAVGRIDYNIKESQVTKDCLESLDNAAYRLMSSTDGNGNVLVFGGYGLGDNESYFINKYDIYGVKTLLTQLSEGKVYATSSTDGEGSVLICGGKKNQSDIANGSRIVDKFDKFGNKTTLTNLNHGRYNLTSSTDGDGNVLIFGGRETLGACTEIIEKYDIYGVLSEVGNASVEREGSTSSTNGNGCILVCGGKNGGDDNETFLATVEKYDTSGTISLLEDLSGAGENYSSAMNGFGNILLLGGRYKVEGWYYFFDILEKYDLSDVRIIINYIELYGSLPACSAFGNENIIASDPYSSKIYQYDDTGTETMLENLCDYREFITAATDGNGSVLFCGGKSGKTILGTIERYNMPQTSVTLNVLVGSKYKFQEHETEQVATSSTITVDRPNKGYVSISGEVTL